MKRILSIIATVLLIGQGVQATTNTTTSTLNNEVNIYTTNGDFFSFEENGVTFAVYQNGEFDFYLNQITTGVQVNYRNNNVNISYNSGYNYDAYFQYDNFGAVIQIQNIPIYYDYYGRVLRIGNIHVNYYDGRVSRLGGMKIYYNRYGAYAYYRGYVNTNNRYYVYQYPKCFIQPYYDYRVVSYQPYRQHYVEHRYTYYNDHSKNKYYKTANSRATHGKKSNEYHSSQRVATTNIPKKRNEQHVQNGRNERSNVNATANYTSRSNNSTNSRNVNHSTNEKNVQNSRNERSNVNTTANNTTRSNNTSNSRNVNRSTNERNGQNNRTVTERKPVTSNNSKSVNLRKPVKVEKKSTVATASDRNKQHRATNTTDIKRRNSN